MHGISLDEAKRMVGRGWGALLERLYARLPEETHVSDVKEKWGALRVYLWDAPLEIYDLLDNLERESLTICEVCGEPGKLRDGAWLKTLCDIHAD